MTSNDFKKGMTIIHNDNIHEILDFQHVKPGKGGAFVRTKLRNLSDQTIIDHTFRAGQKIEQAIVEKEVKQYIYKDKEFYYFMDLGTYEQVPVSPNAIEDIIPFLKEGQNVNCLIYAGSIVSVTLPESVELKVTKAEPGVKGDTASSATKSVGLETGAKIQVPLFINEGDTIKVDTRNSSYIERVSERG